MDTPTCQESKDLRPAPCTYCSLWRESEGSTSMYRTYSRHHQQSTHSNYQHLQFCSMIMLLTLSSVLASLKKFREEAFECAVCLEPCTDTLVNPECNHHFCGKCIKESLHKCNHECPTCRARIPTYRTCRRDPQFDHIVSKPKLYSMCGVYLSSSWRRCARLQYDIPNGHLLLCSAWPIGKGIHCSLGKTNQQRARRETGTRKTLQEIVGQKRRARTGTSSNSASNEQMVAAGGTRRSKRVKVAPTRLCSCSRRGIMDNIPSCFLRRRNKEYYIDCFSTSSWKQQCIWWDHDEWQWRCEYKFFSKDGSCSSCYKCSQRK